MTHPEKASPLTTRNHLLLGLDVGGTKCCAVLGTPTGEILSQRRFATRVEEGPKAVIARLITESQELCGDSSHVAACGVAIGGPLDVNTGVIENPPNLPGWDAIPLRDRLEAALHCAVGIEHDAAACALAESTWGHGRSAKRTIYFTCGTGFGLGMVIDGEPFYGADGRPSEIGHVKIREDGPVAYGKKGSVESFCAASALSRIAAWRFPERWPEAPTPERIAELAAADDELAQRVVEINARAVGDVCAMVADMLRPDLIVLGSLARYLGERWLRLVRVAFDEQALPRVASSTRIVPSRLGEQLPALSSIVVAKRVSEAVAAGRTAPG